MNRYLICAVLFACTDSQPPVTSEAWPELQGYGIASTSTTTTTNARIVELSGRDDALLGSVILDTRVQAARISWHDATYDLAWSADAIDVSQDGVLKVHATSTAIDDASQLFLADETNAGAITIAGLVARENGIAAPWLPPPAPVADYEIAVEGGTCFTSSCSAWDYSTARSCSIGDAYTWCTFSGYSCSRSGDPSCSCGWLSCSCTTTFCGSSQ